MAGALILALTLTLCGCGIQGNTEDMPAPTQAPEAMGIQAHQKPPLPGKLPLNAQGVPMLRVYQVDEEEIREMDLESYLRGVVAGEMKNDWPLEALKAQAILARTFVLKFCTEKESQYQGADISTDIGEAQAYDSTGINDRVEQAVKETRGMVLSYHGQLPYAWFHAHSGGMTERAVEGLHYEGREPGYTQSVPGKESDQAPADVKQWEAEFSRADFLSAAGKAGLSGVDRLDSVAVGEKSPGGRAVTLRVNGQTVSAPELRLALDSTRMRSTWLEEIQLTETGVKMSGKGYGHGVGMPQWGAYGLAEEGKTAQEIVTYYFRDVTVETLW